MACAICARRDWIDHRFRCYLWREADADEKLGDENAEKPDDQEEFSHERTTIYKRKKCEGVFCLGSASVVNEHLRTSKYAEKMPCIPKEELYASSVQHPSHPEMAWLLHTRRVPVLRAANESGAAKPAVVEVEGEAYRCAGVGDADAIVWACKDCINNLCRKDEEIAMPIYAFANLIWIGREHRLYQKLTLGMRMLLSKGRACWRKLILGRGEEETQQKGIQGNHVLLAQSQPTKSEVRFGGSSPWLKCLASCVGSCLLCHQSCELQWRLKEQGRTQLRQPSAQTTLWVC